MTQTFFKNYILSNRIDEECKMYTTSLNSSRKLLLTDSVFTRKNSKMHQNYLARKSGLIRKNDRKNSQR